MLPQGHLLSAPSLQAAPGSGPGPPPHSLLLDGLPGLLLVRITAVESFYISENRCSEVSKSHHLSVASAGKPSLTTLDRLFSLWLSGLGELSACLSTCHLSFPWRVLTGTFVALHLGLCKAAYRCQQSQTGSLFIWGTWKSRNYSRLPSLCAFLSCVCTSPHSFSARKLLHEWRVPSQYFLTATL